MEGCSKVGLGAEAGGRDEYLFRGERSTQRTRRDIYIQCGGKGEIQLNVRMLCLSA